MAESIWGFTSYVEFLKARLTGRENRGRLSRAGESLKVQRSYLSRVLAGELHITPDHAYGLTEFLGLTDDERDYFLTLVEQERASSASYREFQKRRANELRLRYESIDERTQRKALVQMERDVEYFSAWHWSAIHFLTSVPQNQSASSISDRLSLSPSIVAEVLNGLERRGYVKRSSDRWIYHSGEFHTPKEDPLTVIHHQNWRSRAVLDAQMNRDDSLHFTAIQTMSRADFARIRRLMLNFISESSRIAGPSEPEDAIALTCDLFRI
jgi:uncharacterized protein (TIGR02147 family)